MLSLHISNQKQLKNALESLSEPAILYLDGGIYSLKAEINCDNLTLVGAGRETTIITNGDFAKKIHADGREYNTFRTYTLAVTGKGVRLENLTVENSAQNPEKNGQCVALSVHGENFCAVNVDLKSTQDTLFLAPFPDDLVVRYDGFIPRSQLYAEGGLKSVFENCRIYGSVDFIFGCGEAYFKDCELISVADKRNCGYVAAPAHSLAQKRGFVFIGCDFKAAGAGENEVYLARPWRDFGKCEFIGCRLGKHIKPELFDKWNDTARDKTARFSYRDLNGGSLSPVHWSKQLSENEASAIIKEFDGNFKRIKHE